MDVSAVQKLQFEENDLLLLLLLLLLWLWLCEDARWRELLFGFENPEVTQPARSDRVVNTFVEFPGD